MGEALVGNEAVDQLTKFDRALRDFSASSGGAGKERGIDGMLVTKWDTVDDKVGDSSFDTCRLVGFELLSLLSLELPRVWRSWIGVYRVNVGDISMTAANMIWRSPSRGSSIPDGEGFNRPQRPAETAKASSVLLNQYTNFPSSTGRCSVINDLCHRSTHHLRWLRPGTFRLVVFCSVHGLIELLVSSLSLNYLTSPHADIH